MLLRSHPRVNRGKRRDRVGRFGGFSPLQLSAVRAWYRMGSSTAVSGEWETILDVLGGSSLIQTDADRKLAAGTAANGLRIGTYDGSDCMRMPLGASNFNTSKFGLAYWVNPANAGTQYLFAIYNNDATVRVLTYGIAATGRLFLEVYIGTNVDGRTYQTANGAITASAYQYPRLQIDMTKTGEFDFDGDQDDSKIRIFVNEVAQPLSASSFGLGGTPTVLRTPTGAGIFGGVNDNDAPAGAINSGSIHGPNTFILLDTPTDAQATALMNFEVPT